jgi:hypothetical protein
MVGCKSVNYTTKTLVLLDKKLKKGELQALFYKKWS